MVLLLLWIENWFAFVGRRLLGEDHVDALDALASSSFPKQFAAVVLSLSCLILVVFFLYRIRRTICRAPTRKGSSKVPANAIDTPKPNIQEKNFSFCVSSAGPSTRTTTVTRVEASTRMEPKHFRENYA